MNFKNSYILKYTVLKHQEAFSREFNENIEKIKDHSLAVLIWQSLGMLLIGSSVQSDISNPWKVKKRCVDQESSRKRINARDNLVFPNISL